MSCQRTLGPVAREQVASDSRLAKARGGSFVYEELPHTWLRRIRTTLEHDRQGIGPAAQLAAGAARVAHKKPRPPSGGLLASAPAACGADLLPDLEAGCHSPTPSRVSTVLV